MPQLQTPLNNANQQYREMNDMYAELGQHKDKLNEEQTELYTKLGAMLPALKPKPDFRLYATAFRADAFANDDERLGAATAYAEAALPAGTAGADPLATYFGGSKEQIPAMPELMSRLAARAEARYSPGSVAGQGQDALDSAVARESDNLKHKQRSQRIGQANPFSYSPAAAEAIVSEEEYKHRAQKALFKKDRPLHINSIMSNLSPDSQRMAIAAVNTLDYSNYSAILGQVPKDELSAVAAAIQLMNPAQDGNWQHFLAASASSYGGLERGADRFMDKQRQMADGEYTFEHERTLQTALGRDLSPYIKDGAYTSDAERETVQQVLLTHAAKAEEAYNVVAGSQTSRISEEMLDALPGLLLDQELLREEQNLQRLGEQALSPRLSDDASLWTDMTTSTAALIPFTGAVAAAGFLTGGAGAFMLGYGMQYDGIKAGYMGAGFTESEADHFAFVITPLVAGAESLSAMNIFKSGVNKRLLKGMTDGGYRRVATDILKRKTLDGLGEVGTEAGQQVIEDAALRYIDEFMEIEGITGMDAEQFRSNVGEVIVETLKGVPGLMAGSTTVDVAAMGLHAAGYGRGNLTQAGGMIDLEESLAKYKEQTAAKREELGLELGPGPDRNTASPKIATAEDYDGETIIVIPPELQGDGVPSIPASIYEAYRKATTEEERQAVLESAEWEEGPDALKGRIEVIQAFEKDAIAEANKDAEKAYAEHIFGVDSVTGETTGAFGRRMESLAEDIQTHLDAGATMDSVLAELIANNGGDANVVLETAAGILQREDLSPENRELLAEGQVEGFTADDGTVFLVKDVIDKGGRGPGAVVAKFAHEALLHQNIAGLGEDADVKRAEVADIMAASGVAKSIEEGLSTLNPAYREQFRDPATGEIDLNRVAEEWMARIAEGLIDPRTLAPKQKNAWQKIRDWAGARLGVESAVEWADREIAAIVLGVMSGDNVQTTPAAAPAVDVEPTPSELEDAAEQAEFEQAIAAEQATIDAANERLADAEADIAAAEAGELFEQEREAEAAEQRRIQELRLEIEGGLERAREKVAAQVEEDARRKAAAEQDAIEAQAKEFEEQQVAEAEERNAQYQADVQGRLAEKQAALDVRKAEAAAKKAEVDAAAFVKRQEAVAGTSIGYGPKAIDPNSRQALEMVGAWLVEQGQYPNMHQALRAATRMGVAERAQLVDGLQAQGDTKYSLTGRTAISDEFGDGTGYRDFFGNFHKAKGDEWFYPTGEYETAIDLGAGAEEFQRTRGKYMGNFDLHIATSIPGFSDLQAIVGDAILKTYRESGARVLDIGASEGALVKALAQGSEQRITSVAVDPNLGMQDTFNEKGDTEGVDYRLEAFGTSDKRGQKAWDEKRKDADDNPVGEAIDINYFDPGDETFDVVHEAMVFQFLNNNRAEHIAAAKEMMSPEGVAIFEEKFGTDLEEYNQNEIDKDDKWKSKYYTAEQIERKRLEVLAAGGDSVEGMTAMQVTVQEMDKILSDNFAHHALFWQSGNFRGYAASDSEANLKKLVDNMQDTSSEFSQVTTPEFNTEAKYSLGAARKANAEMALQVLNVGLRADGKLQLTHWSPQLALDVLDPAQFGTGPIEGRERKRAGRGFVNRIQYGVDGYQREVEGGARYSASVETEKIYDYKKDPDGFRPLARQEMGRKGSGEVIYGTSVDLNKYESLIRDAGYEGFVSSGNFGPVVAMFEKVVPDSTTLADETLLAPREVDGAGEVTEAGTPKRESLYSLNGRYGLGPAEAADLQNTIPGTTHAVDGLPNFIGMQHVLANPSPAKLRALSKVLKKYPGFNTTSVNPTKVVEEFVDYVSGNLVAMYELASPEMKERAKLWYDGARVVTEDWAKEYGTTTPAVAGVIAANSPQTDWFTNLERAERILRIDRDQREAVVTQDVLTEIIDNVTGSLKNIGKEGGNQELGLTLASAMLGKSYDELTLVQKAAYVMAYSNLNYPNTYNTYTPEGTPIGIARNTTGATSKFKWASMAHVVKSLAIVAGPEYVDNLLGNNAHKIRNFYNNILAPNADEMSVTIDTHAVAAGTWLPLGGNDGLVAHNFGSSVGKDGYDRDTWVKRKLGLSAPASAASGASGTYGLFAEAYRRAAEEVGLLPRELQSITWETVRGLFADTFKTTKNKLAIEKILENKENSAHEKRQQIVKLAGGVTDPVWIGNRPSYNAGAGPARYGTQQSQLPGPGVPGRGARSGDGDGAARGDAGLDAFSLGADPSSAHTPLNPTVSAGLAFSLHILNNGRMTRDEAQAMANQQFRGADVDIALANGYSTARELNPNWVESQKLGRGAAARLVAQTSNKVGFEDRIGRIYDQARTDFQRGYLQGGNDAAIKARTERQRRDEETAAGSLDRTELEDAGLLITEPVEQLIVDEQALRPPKQAVDDDTSDPEDEDAGQTPVSEADLIEVTEVPVGISEYIQNIKDAVTKKSGFAPGDPGFMRSYRATLATALRASIRSLTYGKTREDLLNATDGLTKLVQLPAIDRRAEAILWRTYQQGARTTRKDLIKGLKKEINKKAPAKKSRDTTSSWTKDALPKLYRRQLRMALEMIDMKPADVEKRLAEIDVELNGGLEAYHKSGQDKTIPVDEYTANLQLEQELLQRFGALSKSHDVDGVETPYKTMAELNEVVDTALAELADAVEHQKERLVLRAAQMKNRREMLTRAIRAAVGKAKRGKVAEAINALEIYPLSLDALLQDIIRFATGSTRRALWNDEVTAEGAKWNLKLLSRDIMTAQNNIRQRKAADYQALISGIKQIYGVLNDSQAAKILRDLTRTDKKYAKYSQQENPPPLSKQQLMQFLAYMDQEWYRQNWEKDYHGKGPRIDQKAAIEAELSKEDLALVQWMRNFYAGQRPELSEKKRDITGLPFPADTDDNYMPVGIEQFTGIRGVNTALQVTPGVFTERVHHDSDIVEENGILDIFFDRSQKNATFMELSEVSLDLQAVLGATEVQKALHDTYGKKYLKFLNDMLFDTMSQRPLKGTSDPISKFMLNYGAWAMFWNIGSAVRQPASLWEYALDHGVLNATKWSTNWASSDMNMYVRDMFRSPQAVARLGQGQSYEMAAAFESEGMGYIKTLVNKYGMAPNKLMDALTVAVMGAGVYKKYLDKFRAVHMDPDKAKKMAMEWAWAETEIHQQSSFVSNSAPWQRNGNAAERLFGMFSSTPQQFLSIQNAAIRRGRATGDWKPFWMSVVVHHILGPATYMAIKTMFNLAKGEPPDEDEWKEWLGFMIIGPYSGAFIGRFLLGYAYDVISDSGSANFGMDMIPAAGGVEELIEVTTDVTKGIAAGDGLKVMEAIDSSLQTLAPYRDVSDVVENYGE